MPYISDAQKEGMPVVSGTLNVTRILYDHQVVSDADKDTSDTQQVYYFLKGRFQEDTDPNARPDYIQNRFGGVIEVEKRTSYDVTIGITDEPIYPNDKIRINYALKYEHKSPNGKYDNTDLVMMASTQMINESARDRKLNQHFKNDTLADYLSKNIQGISFNTAERIVPLLGNDVQLFKENLKQLSELGPDDEPTYVQKQIEKMRGGKRIVKALMQYAKEIAINQTKDQGFMLFMQEIEKHGMIQTQALKQSHPWLLTQNEWTNYYAQHISDRIHSINDIDAVVRVIQTKPYELLVLEPYTKGIKGIGTVEKRLLYANILSSNTPLNQTNFLLSHVLIGIQKGTKKEADSAYNLEKHQDNLFYELRRDLMQTADRTRVSQIDNGRTQEIINYIENLDPLHYNKWGLPARNVYVVNYKHELLTRKNYDLVKRAATNIKERLSVPPEPLIDENVLIMSAQTEFKNDNPNIPNAQLDDSQINALLELNKNNFTIITGGPGTGKTSILKYYLKAYLSQVCHGNMWQLKQKVNLLAPIGKAAKRMTQQVKDISKNSNEQISAQTIHRRLKLRIEQQSNIDYNMHNIGNKKEKDFTELIFIDEASMLSEYLNNQIFAKIHNKNVKLVFIGDVDQLPSIDAGRVLHDLIETNEIPTAKLTKIHRNQGNIVENAKLIREQELTDKWLLDQPDFKIIDPTDFKMPRLKDPNMYKFTFDYLIQEYKKLKPEEYADLCILCPYRQYEKNHEHDPLQRLNTDFINDVIQKALREDEAKLHRGAPNNPASLTIVNPQARKNHPMYLRTIYKNDYVINKTNFRAPVFEIEQQAEKYARWVSQLKNLHSKDSREKYPNIEYQTVTGDASELIFNGDTGYVVNLYTYDNPFADDIDDQFVTTAIVKTEDGYIPFIQEEMRQLGLAYALTIHKAQGSEYKHVVVIQPAANAFTTSMNCREILYTAVTRAKKTVKIISEKKDVDFCVKTQSNQRETILKDLILDAVNNKKTPAVLIN